MEEEDKEFDKVHNAIDLPKVSDEELNIQVISPMYGNDVPTNKPVSSIPAYTVPTGKRTERNNEQVSRVSALDLSDALEEGQEGVVRESLFKEENKK
jgi:formiminotetrahydrofolate cyclodeaminase